MTEVRPVQLETPQKRLAFIDTQTGGLTTYGHRVLTALFERTGGFDDEVWFSLGLGFQAVSSQGRTDNRLADLEGARLGLEGAINGIRGDPRLATAERAEGKADDAMAVALSRAPPDALRRIDELERWVAAVAAGTDQIRFMIQQIKLGIEQAQQEGAILQTYEMQRSGAVLRGIEDLVGVNATQFRGKVADAVSVIVQNGTGLSWAYNSTLKQMTGTVSLSSFTTTDLAEGTNLYYTNTRADGRIAAAVGVSVQAYSANLDEFAGVNPTAAGLALLDDATAADQRTTLGLGSLATQNTVNNGDWSGADLDIANGGTGASTASAARTALGLEIGTDVLAYVAPSPGWTAATGTATRTTFDTASVTLPQLAERVKALIDDGLAANRLGA